MIKNFDYYQIKGMKYPEQITNENFDEIYGKGNWVIIKEGERPIYAEVERKRRIKLDMHDCVSFVSPYVKEIK